MLRVRSIGYLVPQSFDGIVHSVFARACNVVDGDWMWTLAAPGVAAAPTALVLSDGEPIDLRCCYRVGDRVARRRARLASRAALVDLADANVWRPCSRAPSADRSRIVANLRRCRAKLDARLPEHASIIHREGRPVCVALERACGDRDLETAIALASRLVGWGEGLTPAGDDFLVGLLAALHALDEPLAARLGAALEAQCERTTAIAAHALRLAARGHFSADLVDLRDALLSSCDFAMLDRATDDALDVGATSGCDRVSGLVAGMSASLA
jgi:hypothetical protein